MPMAICLCVFAAQGLKKKQKQKTIMTCEYHTEDQQKKELKSSIW